MTKWNRIGMWAAACAGAGLVLTVAAAGQMGPRTLANSTNLDMSTMRGRIELSSADSVAKKRTVIKDLERLEPAEWQASALTWLTFSKQPDGTILIIENGTGKAISGVRAAAKKWEVEALPERTWSAHSAKAGSKLDVYLDAQHKGESFEVGAVVPLDDGEVVGAVYRGIDFLFFVVQRKPPEKAG